MDLVDAVSYHQLVLHTEGRSNATLELYLLYEKRFLEYLDARGIQPTLEALNAVTARQAVLWFQQRRLGARGGEVATKTFLDTLKTWAAFLEREGVWTDSPLRKVRRVKTRKLERKPFSRAEVQAMLGACDQTRLPERDRLLLQLLLDTGARNSEIVELKLDDVDLKRRQVRVLGKGNRERTVPIGISSTPDGGPLVRAHRAWLQKRSALARRHPERAGERLFLTLSGFPLTAHGCTDVVKRLGDLAGVEGAVPHRFRHTYCTLWLTQYPGDELGLRRVVGHLSKDVTADYVHLAQQEIALRAGRVSPTQHWLRESSR